MAAATPMACLIIVFPLLINRVMTVRQRHSAVKQH
jgi:hypothetical protein